MTPLQHDQEKVAITAEEQPTHTATGRKMKSWLRQQGTHRKKKTQQRRREDR